RPAAPRRPRPGRRTFAVRGWHGAGSPRRRVRRRRCGRARAFRRAPRRRSCPEAGPRAPARARARAGSRDDSRQDYARDSKNPHMDSLATRTLELVDIPSVSRDEARIVDHVRALMPAPPDFDDDTVLFYPGRVVLAGHYDTVPAQENIPGSIENGWVVGLGATDMKGGVAVMVELARSDAPFGYL